MNLKHLLTLTTLVAALAACQKDDHAGHNHGSGGHDHDAEKKASAKAEHKHVKAPNGGKIFEIELDHIEFAVEADRTATVRFYDKDMKPLQAGARIVTAIGDAPGGKVTLAFAVKGDALASASVFPKGPAYPVAVTYKADAEAKPVNFRFKLDLGTCGECKLKEYACACDH